jgi:type VI secretion system protein ImpH
LERLLQNYFKIPVEIEQFSGRWLNLQPENRTRLPGSERPKGQFNSIGRGVILGRRVWDVQSKIRLIVGPVRQDQFRRYLPDGDLLKPICEVTRTYLGPGLAFDLLVKVDRPAVEPTRLVSEEGQKYQLGWNSWLKADSKTTGISEVVFSSGTE